MNVLYLSILRKERLLKYLKKFAYDLLELEEFIRSTDIGELRKSPVNCRKEIVDAIGSRYPEMYADYKEVRDITSLYVMKTYLNVALLANSATRPGQLTIKRALQVTGEHLKNTLDSPKLSPAAIDLLLLSAPKETRKVLKDLRLSLSHPHLDSGDSILYSNIKNDMKKIASVITAITNYNKVEKIKRMLITLINSDGVDDIRENLNIFRNVFVVDTQETDTITKDHQRFVDLIKNIEGQTPYEKKLLTEIKNVLDQTNIQQDLTSVDYYSLKELVQYSSFVHAKAIGQTIHFIKSTAYAVLRNITSQKHPLELEKWNSLGSLLIKLYNSVSMRIKPEIAFEIQIAIARINFTGSFDKRTINSIKEYSRKFNRSDHRLEKCNVKRLNNGREKISKQLTLKLTELENAIGTDRICGDLYAHLSLLYKDETTNRFMVEALVLDIMSLLDTQRCIPDNVLHLDGDVSLLNGKCLRNHLAHGNTLIDILPTDAWSALLLNAVKLIESKSVLLNRKIGNILKHDVKQLRRRYARGLSVLDKQKVMWKSLLDGNFENLVLGITGGADICTRRKDLSTTLHYAARGPNIETIKFLCKQKIINTEAIDVDGQTALHIAATFGRDDTVKFLVTEMGNAINQVDNDGKTPLHLASQNGHKKTVQLLLSMGIKTTVRDITGNSSMKYAVMYNYLNVVKILMANKSFTDVNNVKGGYTFLHTAAEFGHVEIVQYLLVNEADVNARTNLGLLPLHLAASIGNQKIVNALLEKGAHVNLVDSRGFSALYYAARNNHKDIIKILLEEGAFVNTRSRSYNVTPFHVAVSNGNASIVSLLLKYKVNVNAITIDGFNALLYAAEGGYVDIVELLLQNGALACSRDVNGSTVLHIAAGLGHTSVVETLTHRGIKVNTQNTQQCTPLHLAALAGHKQTVDILLSAGANVHFVNDEGSTALHLSARNAHEAISKALIEKGANVNCKNNSYMTPLHEAATKTSNEKTIKILQNNGANVNEKGELGGTALHIASFTGDSLSIEALLQGKAYVNAEDNLGVTSFHLAASGNHKAAVQVLLRYGADVNHLDTTGSSALCCAAENNNTDLLNILIANGADVNFGRGKLLISAIKAGHRLVVEALLNNKNVDIGIKDGDGLNLLYIAAVGGDALIARALIKRGIKVADCIQDPSPLLIAIWSGHTEFVEVLLKNGANINPKNHNLSPLFVAVHMNKSDITEMLLHWGADSNIRDLKNRTPLELAVANAQMPNTLTLLRNFYLKKNY